jgi:hypothetical protein
MHHNFSYVEVVLVVVVVVVLSLHMSGSEFLQSFLLNVQVYIYISKVREHTHRLLIINICHEVGDGIGCGSSG